MPPSFYTNIRSHSARYLLFVLISVRTTHVTLSLYKYQLSPRKSPSLYINISRYNACHLLYTNIRCHIAGYLPFILISAGTKHVTFYVY